MKFVFVSDSLGAMAFKRARERIAELAQRPGKIYCSFAGQDAIRICRLQITRHLRKPDK